MPVYEVQDDFGRKLELRGDSEPTEAELEEIFEASFPKTPSQSPAITAPGEAQPLLGRAQLMTPVPQAFPAVEQARAETAKLPALSLEEAEQILSTPQVSIPRVGEPGTVTRGVSEVASGLVEQAALTPLSPVLALATAVPGVRIAAGTLLSAAGTKAAAEKLGEASVTGNPQTITEGVALGALSALGAAGTAIDSIARVAPATAQAVKATTETLKPERITDAVPKREAEALPLEKPPEVSEGVVTEVRKQAAQKTPEVSQALGVTPSGRFAKAIDAIMPRESTTPPPIQLKPNERLPSPRPFEEAKQIFAQPFGMGKLPVLGVVADANARIRTPVHESINTYYANRHGVGPAIAAALGEEIKGTIDPAFAIDPKTSTITNIKPNREGLSLQVADVFETLQREPDAYTLTPEQQAALGRIQGVLDDVKALQEREGLSFRADDEGVSAEQLAFDVPEEAIPTDSSYFPRIVTERPNAQPQTPRTGGVGAKQFFQKSRMFESEAEGVSQGYRYEPSIERRLTTLVDRTYKAIFDKQFANDPALGGRTIAELRKDVETALADKIASGEISAERLNAIVESKAAKGRVWEPGLMKMVFEPEVAEVLNKQLPRPTSSLGQLYMTVNNAARELKLSGDLSAPMIQLLPTLYRNPVIWGKSVGNAMKALVQPDTFSNYAKQNLGPIREMAQLGSSVGRLEALLSGAPGRSVLERTKLGKAFAPFQRHFQSALDVAKVELWKAWREVTPPEQRLEVMRTIESQLGTSRIESGAIKHNQAFTERALLLANSYYRGAMNYLALTGQKGVSGKIARQGLGSLMAGGAATYVGIAYGLGMTEDEIQERLDPRRGTFMMWPVKVGDRVVEVGFGAFYKSLLRLGGNVLKTSVEHPENWASLAPDKNPFTRWWRGHASLPVGVAWNQFSGSDFLGRDSSIADIVPSLAAPLASEALRDKLSGREADVSAGQVAVESLASFMGFSAYQESKRNQMMRTLNDDAQKRFGKEYDKLPIADQRNVAERVQSMAAFKERAEPTKREREMAFQADIDRVLRIRKSLPEAQVKTIDNLGVKLRGFDPALTVGKVKIPLTRQQSIRYEELIKDEYGKMVARILPSLERLKTPEIRQKALDEALTKAREAAKARMMTQRQP